MPEYTQGEVVTHSDKGCQVKIIKQMGENRFGKTYLVHIIGEESKQFKASEKSLQ
jgi:hypothetical protein